MSEIEKGASLLGSIEPHPWDSPRTIARKRFKARLDGVQGVLKKPVGVMLKRRVSLDDSQQKLSGVASDGADELRAIVSLGRQPTDKCDQQCSRHQVVANVLADFQSPVVGIKFVVAFHIAMLMAAEILCVWVLMRGLA